MVSRPSAGIRASAFPSSDKAFNRDNKVSREAVPLRSKDLMAPKETPLACESWP